MTAPNQNDKAAQFAEAAKVAGVKARRFTHRAANKLARMTAEPKKAKPAAAPKAAQPAAAAKPALPQRPAQIQRLSPSEALKENGFTVFRNAFSADEVATLAAAMKAEAGITEGQKYMKVDAPSALPTTRGVLFDDRVLYAVRAAIGADGRFLQVSDLHYRHDTAEWHRDSVHRAPDASEAPDWAELDGGDFGVVKAILYMESENAAMGFIPGSHLDPNEIDRPAIKRLEEGHQQIVVGDSDEPNRRFTEEEKKFPFAWKSNPGDLLVFDERLYHAGRRVNNDQVSNDRGGEKFTLSLVFGADNRHSERMYSYFRYARRELGYGDLEQDFRDELANRGLVLTAGWGNYYEHAPQDLRHAYLKKPETMEPLIEEFTAAGKAAGAVNA